MSGGSTKHKRRLDAQKFAMCKEVARWHGTFVWLAQVEMTDKVTHRQLCKAFAYSRNEDNPILLLVSSEGKEYQLNHRGLGRIMPAEDSEVVFEILKGAKYPNTLASWAVDPRSSRSHWREAAKSFWISNTLYKAINYWQWRHEQMELSDLEAWYQL